MPASVKDTLEGMLRGAYAAEIATEARHIDIIGQISLGAVGTGVDCHGKLHEVGGRFDIEDRIGIELSVGIAKEIVNPLEAVVEEVMQDFHLGIIGAQGHRILMNYAVEDGPAGEVETL